MITRIEIYTKVEDARTKAKIAQIKNAGINRVSNLEYVDVYTIEKELTSEQLGKIASALANPVTQEFSIRIGTSVIPSGVEGSLRFGRDDKKEFVKKSKKFEFALELGFLPGVTDNVAHTTKELIEDLLKVKFSKEENVYSSILLLLKGNLTEKNISKIGLSLANPLIQRTHSKSFAQFKKDLGMDFLVPKVTLEQEVKVLEVDLNVSDEELVKIGKLGIKNEAGTRRGPLALDLQYMKTIQTYFKKQKRNPTDIELEALAQTWSEHCKHTIFADPIDDIKEGLFRTFIKGATDKVKSQSLKVKNKFIAKVFTDNSGAIEFDENYLITHKTETHNTPSALDPFGGAITGIVGVNRDALGFGLGAKPILNTYGFCFAEPEDTKPLFRGLNKTQPMLLPRRIMEGVVAGVNAGGNQSGIPTPQGFLYFDERYKGKPLVFVGTVGLIPKKVGQRNSIDKKAEVGDYIVMLGGKVGIDGVHGATFSSEALDMGSPSTAVQIGDPITQKKFSDALVNEARDLNLYNSITDNGAGGLSSSVSEMAKESGGCEVWLEKVPLKYPGLEPWQIWISESQERMTLAVPKKNWEKLQSLLKRRGVDAWVIGEFNNSGKCVVKYNNEVVLDMEMDFLHDGLPKKYQVSSIKYQAIKTIKFKEPKDLSKIFIEMLGKHNICGYDFISTQFDHTVTGLAVTYPVQGKGRVNSEFSVSRPFLETEKGVVLSQGFYPNYSEINPYLMAMASLDTAVKNAVIAGANLEKLAILDNFCWCSSTEPERLGQLKAACKACFDLATKYLTPFISGKDSMFNDFKGFDENGNPVKISIPPTLLISSIGVIDDVKNSITLDFKNAGDLIYLLGETFAEIGGSEYLRQIDAEGGKIPEVSPDKNYNLYKSYAKAVEQGLIASGIGVNLGGLLVALGKSAMSGMLGVEVELNELPGKVERNDLALFSESQGRILVSVSPDNKTKFEKVMSGNAIREIGKVRGDGQINVKGLDKKLIIKTDVNKSLESYRRRFGDW